MHGAPVSPREPPATTHVARAELGRARRRGAACRAARAGVISPTSALARRAARDADVDHAHLARVRLARARSTGPAWRAWNVAVAAARTAAPATSPVEASTPLGTSAATTVPVARVDRLDRAARPARAARRSKPVPSSASTMTAAPWPAARRRRRPAPSPGSCASFACASLAQPLRRPERAAPRRRGPASRSSRAATSRRRRCCPCRRRPRSGPAGDVLGDHAREPLPRALHQLERRDRLRPRSPSASVARISCGVGQRLAASAGGSPQHRHRAGHRPWSA